MYKSRGEKGLFDDEFTKERLSLIGNPLESVSKVIDFELFRESLESKLLNTNKKNNAGAKPYDVVMLFKILILQRYYGLGDSQVEYQIVDRTSFKTFLGLETSDKVPDEKTVWSFRERVTCNRFRSTKDSLLALHAQRSLGCYGLVFCLSANLIMKLQITQPPFIFIVLFIGVEFFTYWVKQ